MGNIEDITKLMRKGPEFLSQTNALKMNTKSVARGAKDATFQFPCLVSDSIPIDMANTIARTLDQVYATFTQTWLSVNSMFDITIDPTPLSYLKKLHQNMKLESGLIPEEDDEVYIENSYDGKYKLFMDKDCNYGILFNVSDTKTYQMLESHRELLKEYHIEEVDPNELVTEAITPDSAEFIDSVIQGEVEKNRVDKAFKISDKAQAPKLLERDVKKANDLTPYGIQVRLIAINDKKEFVQYIDFVVGVKVILHPVKSADLVENVARALQNKSVVFKLLRWTTGEISLIKDIILNLDDIKLDATSTANGKSPFFRTLKRLKKRKVGMRNITVPHALIPNSTIVMSSYEVDYLRDNFAINVQDEKVALKLMDSLFLMAFMIVDEGTNTVSILYDGDNTFQTYALETLERENSLSSNKLGREIGRMISR